MNRKRKLPIVLALVSLAACTSYERPLAPPHKERYRPPEPPAAETRPATPPAEVYVPKEPSVHEVPAVQSPPAVIALLDTAESERQSGRLDSAVATLERAIKIQPRNARLWHEMAALRLEQNQPRLALDLARKSNTLASGDHALKQENWRIIAESKRLLGDPDGAARALEEADR
ncbi:MAG: tetratricopeptide repeat protein [Methylococcaceae bacterium]|nr:tetratricopeptide repeat protein [Methylococcaceae bacterium]MCI0733706.1 tetratricopeptide repeat protein [Methylococcaceae bacterium]